MRSFYHPLTYTQMDLLTYPKLRLMRLLLWARAGTYLPWISASVVLPLDGRHLQKQNWSPSGQLFWPHLQLTVKSTYTPILRQRLMELPMANNLPGPSDNSSKHLM